MERERELRLAILIDAENITEKYLKIILEEAAKTGVATYKRIYGDWTSQKMSSWKHVLLDHSIIPIQQYGYTTGKSSTDSAMIIDAMDILYSGDVDGFCLVSSDSDFTRLAARLRESGMDVTGMGESKTPKPFIAACNRFRYLDILYSSQQQEEKKEETKEIKEKEEKGRSIKKPQAKEQAEMQPRTNLKVLKRAIRSIAQECSDDEGWIFSAELRNQLNKRFPDFDVRNFGYSKFTPFVESLDIFEVKRTRSGLRHVQLVYFKLKK
ncbi:MAG: NYN domain-containing protein [Lachnospiraceae bacterium]|nr:NYN domain-containing protein [Lachnospiraceae bacterium]